MDAALQIDFVNASEYLAAEEAASDRHEYVAGVVYAMAGASREHNRIAGNIFAALHAHLAGKRCQVSISDLKLRIPEFNSESYYYPDIMVTCDPRDHAGQFNQFPSVIIEVLSQGTERIDLIEKFNAYIKIDTLQDYVVVSQAAREAVIFRRSENWKPEKLADPNDSISLPSIGFRIPLAEAYRGL